MDPVAALLLGALAINSGGKKKKKGGSEKRQTVIYRVTNDFRRNITNSKHDHTHLDEVHFHTHHKK